MGTPWCYPMCCIECGARMDPNGDHLKDKEGESVCSEDCRVVRNRLIAYAESDQRIALRESRERAALALAKT